MRIIWTDEAVGTLEAITTYVAAFNPDAATKLAGQPMALADSLADFPHRGRDAGEGQREMTTVWPYILRYRVVDGAVLISRVRHVARDKDEAGVG